MFGSVRSGVAIKGKINSLDRFAQLLSTTMQGKMDHFLKCTSNLGKIRPFIWICNSRHWYIFYCFNVICFHSESLTDLHLQNVDIPGLMKF